MLKNKKFLIGFFTCASLFLIMAHDSNHSHYDYASSYHSHNDSHSHYEYADNYHSHNDYISGNYADENHNHDFSYPSYAKKDHTHDTGWITYAEEDHTHDGWNGYAKQTDVSDLEARIEDLESEIQRLRNHDH